MSKPLLIAIIASPKVFEHIKFSDVEPYKIVITSVTKKLLDKVTVSMDNVVSSFEFIT